MQHLSTKELAAIKSAVNEGLGLSILLTDKPEDWNCQNSFKQFINMPTQTGSATYTFGAKKNAIEFQKIPLALKNQLGIFPLHQSESGQIIAAYKLKGTGRISWVLLSETYQLLLEGQKNNYAKFWTPILEQTSRRINKALEWTIEHELITKSGHPCKILLSKEGNLEIGQFRAQLDSLWTPFYFKQHPLNPAEWEATVWPKKFGWHALNLRENSPSDFWFYVPKQAAWQSLKTYHQLKHNMLWVAKHNQLPKNEAAAIEIPKPIPSWYFYLAFLVGIAILWLEEKL